MGAFIRVDIPQLSSICMSNNDEAWQIKINDTLHTLFVLEVNYFPTLLEKCFYLKSAGKILSKRSWLLQ